LRAEEEEKKREEQEEVKENLRQQRELRIQ